MDKDLQTKLEMYKILYTAYADEIKNLWQRSIFLGAFMVLVWSGYGALQLKIFDKDFEISANYCAMSLGFCTIIIVLSWLWIAMAKGSKFVQEAHENHIKHFDFQNNNVKKLYCDLDFYEWLEHADSQSIPKDKTLNPKLNESIFCCGTLNPYRYSPSKINIALGWVSCLLGSVLFLVHSLSIIYTNLCLIVCILIVLGIFAGLCFGQKHLKTILKGGNTKNKE